MRERLLWVVLLGTWSGYAWMLAASAPRTRSILALLTLSVVIGGLVTAWQSRQRLTRNLLTANLALGSILHLLAAGLVVLGDQLGQSGLVPTLATHWRTLLGGLLGITVAALTWRRARPAPAPPASRPLSATTEPAPPTAPVPDWQATDRALQGRGDTRRQRSLAALQRIDAVLDGDGPAAERLEQARRVVHQEARRLADASTAEARAAEGDVLSQLAELVEWGTQKLPELGDMDLSDLLMAKAIADIQATHDRITHVFVDHRELVPIHPIDRPTAIDKAEERAAAARRALPLLEANGMQLSEGLIEANPELSAFASVTGFCVVDMGDGYVTFEGNGRREALQRAFGDARGVLVEVRRFDFDDPGQLETIRRRVRRVQRYKGLR